MIHYKIMVLKNILQAITQKTIKKEITAIKEIKLPPILEKWVKAYEEVGDRNQFIWKWTYLGWQIFTLSCVSKKYQKSIVEIKTCNTMLNALVDDIVDKRKNIKMLNETIAILLDSQTVRNLSFYKKEEQQYLILVKDIWKFIQKNIKDYPRYEEFRDIFYFDLKQFLNTMEYSYLINTNINLINLTEHDVYSHHNMQGMVSMTIDLMCSPLFDIKELGIFREISWLTQQMGRVGNLIATWEKEIRKNDFTSGIFSYAIKNNIIRANDLKNENKRKEIIKIIKSSKVESYFLNKWENYYNEIGRLAKNIKSVDIKRIMKAHKKFLMMHLVSKGLEV